MKFKTFTQLHAERAARRARPKKKKQEAASLKLQAPSALKQTQKKDKIKI